MLAGVMVYLYLRRSFAGVVEASAGKHLPSMLKKLFPCGLIFPALLGFLSVSYESCDRTTYKEIVEYRTYLVAKNHEQISAVLFCIVVAVLLWNLIALLILRSSQQGKKG